MNLARLAGIAWGRRWVVLTPMICSVLGGVYVILTFPPRYEATSRVMLDIIKADPITGFRVSSKNYDAYVASQASIIRDDQVAGRVVDDMGWLDNADLAATYAQANDKTGDFRHWVARRIIYGTGVEIVGDTNILAIKYQSTSPELARVVADNLRSAYIQETVDQQRETSRAGGEHLALQANRERNRLLQLQVAKGALERETGIVMSDGAPDTDIHTLRGLEGASAMPVAVPKAVRGRRGQGAALTIQLAQLDSAIAAASKVLGPNHPMLLGLQRRREELAKQLPAGQALGADEGQSARQRQQSVSTLITRQAGKILSQGDKVLALHLIDDEIARRRKLYKKATENSGALLQLANINDTNLTPVGETTVDPDPKFPNLPLILLGSGGFGLAGGLLLAFFLETLARRVRGAADLGSAVPAPVIATIPRYAIAQAKRDRSKPPKVGRVKIKVERPPKASRRKPKLASA